MKHLSATVILFSFFALGAGVVNGLLGTGGGILLTLALSKVLPREEYSKKDIFVSSMAAVIPISVISLITYRNEISLTVTSLLGIVFPSAVGGVIGAVVASKLKSAIVEKAFAILIVYAGIRMLISMGGTS